MNDCLIDLSCFKLWLAVLGLLGAVFHFFWGWLVPYLAERRNKKARAQAEHGQVSKSL